MGPASDIRTLWERRTPSCKSFVVGSKREECLYPFEDLCVFASNCNLFEWCFAM